MNYGHSFMNKSCHSRSEYDTLGTSIKAAAVYLGTALVKVSYFATCLIQMFHWHS